MESESDFNSSSSSDEQIPDTSAGYVKWNSEGKPMTVWLVSENLEDLNFWMEFLKKRMKIQDPISENCQENFLKGKLRLGNANDYQVEITRKTPKFEDYASAKVEVIIFYAKGLCLADREDWRPYKNWEHWEHVKRLGFIEPMGCPGECTSFYEDMIASNTESNFRDLLKETQKRKVPPKTGADSHIYKSGSKVVSSDHVKSQTGGDVDKKTESESEQLPVNMDKLKDDLYEFLCLKFLHTDVELENRVEDPTWEEKFKNWPAIRSILTSIETPDECTCYDEEENRNITVILPNTDVDPERNFRFLKAAAYYPYQMDPQPFFNYGHDENILKQLAFSTWNGYWGARYYLTIAGFRFPLLNRRHIMIDANVPQWNEDDTYYSLPLPEKYWGNGQYWENEDDCIKIPFNHKTDEKNTNAFWDYLFSIASQGKRPEKVTYASKP